MGLFLLGIIIGIVLGCVGLYAYSVIEMTRRFRLDGTVIDFERSVR